MGHIVSLLTLNLLASDYVYAMFSLSLRHRNVATLLRMLFLDTTMKCKVV